jgi:hypothetical protein
LLSIAVTAAAFGLHGVVVREAEILWRLPPLPYMDAMNGIGPTDRVTRALKATNAPKSRYLLGWLRHTAGDFDVAIKEYVTVAWGFEGLSANLQAAREGHPPASQLSATDFLEAASRPTPWKQLVFGLESVVVSRDGERDFHALPVVFLLRAARGLLLLMALQVGVMIAAGLAGENSGGSSSSSGRDGSGPDAAVGRSWTTLLSPGVNSLGQGRGYGGYIVVALGSFSVIGGGLLLWYAPLPPYLAVGFATAKGSPASQIIYAFPVPPDWHGALWTHLEALPRARSYTIGLATAGAVAFLIQFLLASRFALRRLQRKKVI